ncbi:MAG: hypothetical protein JOZ78_06920 [Chroococcidiopsidaceae cyanobacterium CP_BM_ER_R8_30]|nr:hypothetical protein [Chroococcidiopsidaceae cyanobacterium CP_BM_ER_R8_30]
MEILDLNMSDEEYLHLIAQGRDPVQEHIYVKNLMRVGVTKEEATKLIPMLKKAERSPDEEALFRRVWQQVYQF